MNFVTLHGHSDTYVDVLVKDVAALETAVGGAVTRVEWVGDTETADGERAIARLHMNDSVVEEGLDIETILENVNYFMFVGVEAFRALIQLSNVLQDLHAPYQIVDVETPREEEGEKRGVYIHVEPIHPLVGMMLEGFLMAMEENGVNVEQGTAIGVDRDGEETEHVFIFFPERGAIAEVEAPELDVTCPISVGNYMRAATSEADWNARADAVKAANGGDYPSFWFIVVILGGVLSEARANW